VDETCVDSWLFKTVPSMVEECGDLVLVSSDSRLGTGLVVLVAILVSAVLAGERAASHFSPLVQLGEAGLGHDGGFSRGRVGTLVCSHD
jgi:hypothetical protein